MRLAAPFVTLVLFAALVAGCGSSEDSTSTETGPAAAPKDSAKPPVGAAVKSCALAAGGAVRLRTVGTGCGEAQRVALAWGRRAACAADPGASRTACSVGRYRCLATATDRGLLVGCARPGEAVSFRVRG